jgi:hypothetical protein
VSTFDQYIFSKPKAQGPIKAKLAENWDTTTKLMVTMPQMRRNVLRPMGIKGNPPTIVIEFDNPGYAKILDLAHTNVEHIEKFAAQAVEAKMAKARKSLLANIRTLLGDSF